MTQLNVSQNLIEVFLEKFSNEVKNKVIDSKWVPGVKDYIETYYQTKSLFIITATPQAEIEEILKKFKLKIILKNNWCSNKKKHSPKKHFKRI